jgi:hypothetical protein
MGEPSRYIDFRSVPLEVLRDFVRTRAEATSIRQVAAEMRLGRTTLHSFINEETTPHPRIRRIIALWYLDWVDTAPDFDLVRPYASALEMLVRGLPEQQREGTVAIVLGGLESGYIGGGESPPHWLEVLQFVARRTDAHKWRLP